MSVQESLDKLSKSYFTEITEQVSKIYVDMEILQDLRLGALLQTATVPEEIEYIQSCIPEYNNRLDLKTAEHFPVLNKTDDELDQIIKANPIKTALVSPWTKIYYNFQIVLGYLHDNTRIKDTKPSQLLIVINTETVPYPLPLFDKLAKLIKKTYPEATIKASSYKRYDGEEDLYLSSDMFFLYDHEKFLNTPFVTKMMNSPKYKTRTIYTTPVVNTSLGLDESEYLKGLMSTGATLNLFFDFFYMPTGINLEPTSR